MRREFDLQKAAQLLHQAGWRRGSDGVRVKAGRRMKLMYQTSMNPVRQKDASDYQEAFEQTGMEVELKAVNPRIFFSSDPGNADAYAKFHAALQMFTVSPGSSDPQAHMTQSVSWEVARKANNWASQNVVRWGTPHTIGSGIRPRWS
jgi:peptide/nickel transport system substrate-binding protein